MSPGLMEEACAMAPRGDMRFENQGKVFATLWEQFNWDTAVQMMGLMGDRMQDAAMCRAAARAVLVGEYGFTQRELEEPGKGGEYLRSFQLPMGAVREHEDFWRYSKEVDSLRRALAMMPRYLAAARRGLGGEAWVLVRYVRKALRSGEKYGRAYPSVIGGDGETVLRGVPSLTTMPREVRNALISFPRQTLLDFDLAKCYPSIMLAAARMHGFEEGAMALLEGFLADPKATMARIATEAKCDSGGAKQMINQIISDPRKRHHRSLGTWLGRFEEEIHGLRERLVDAHEEGVAFRDELRGDGSPPNMGTVVYRVLTDYEVRVIEVAAREFQKRGVRVGTYEYDGLKVEAEGWGKLGPRAQQWLLHEVTRQVDRLVFAGRSGGVMHLVQKEMGYEGYAQGLRLLGGAERGVVVQGGSSRSEGEGREADDDGGPQGVQEGAGEEGGLGPGCGSASGADDADGGEAGHGSKGPSHPRQCEEEGFTEGRGPGADFGDGEDTACSGGVDPESGGARCSYQGEMALTARESMGNGGEHAGKEGGGQRGAGEDGHKGSAGAGVVVGGGTVGIVETACCRLRNGYSRWVHDAMVWAEKRGWIRWEVMMRFMEEADKHVVRVSSQRSTLLEVGLGWGGFEEGARRVLDRLGIRHVGLDRAAHKIGSREDPDELGHTLPELLGDITSGKERGLVQWCMKRAQFDVEALLGVFISMDCVEETGAAHMPGGRHYKGEPRSEQQEDTVDTVVAAVKWLQSNRPRVSIVLEQPKSSALVDDPRMVGLGLRTVAVDGCAYGLFHRKGYHLWMTMGEDEFVPRVTKEHCLYCEMGMKHPQGMIPPKGSWQSRVRWEGYSIDAARNRMPVLLGEELAEAMVRAWERRG